MAAAQSQRHQLTDWNGYARQWSALHGGYDPRTAGIFVRGWLRIAYVVARPLASAGVHPSTVTSAGVVVAAGVPAVASLGPWWGPLGALLVLLGAVADSADGALALVAGRETRLGQVYDSVADRVTEAAWLVALFLLGAPGWLVCGCLAVTWLHEYVRARATVAGMSDIGAVTVGERPTRVLVALFGLLAVGVAEVVDRSGTAATVTAVVWVALGLVGLLQLAVAVRRALR
nr:CDP-alcohol phosphatidyltransferase family protein [Virgisporangium ochraceum]